MTHVTLGFVFEGYKGNFLHSACAPWCLKPTVDATAAKWGAGASVGSVKPATNLTIPYLEHSFRLPPPLQASPVHKTDDNVDGGLGGWKGAASMCSVSAAPTFISKEKLLAQLKTDDLKRRAADACSTRPMSTAAYVLMYTHTWRRSAGSIATQLANASAAHSVGALDAVAIESFTIQANLSLAELATGAGAPPLGEVVQRAQRSGLHAFGYLINEADTGYVFNCSVASRLFAPTASEVFIQAIVAATDRLGLDGLVLDLEPSEGGCTGATGQEFAAFLARVRAAVHPKPVRVYAEQWQYHGIETFFSYREDAQAAGRVVSGLTYDGRPPSGKPSSIFNSARALANWNSRLDWLLTDPKNGLLSPQLLAAGLTTDRSAFLP